MQKTFSISYMLTTPLYWNHQTIWPIYITIWNDLLNLNQSYFVHSFIYNKLPPSFNNFFSKLPGFDRNLSLCTTLLKNSQLKLLPSYTLPLLWNSLPLSTKRISSASKFKRTCAEKLFSYYSSTCSKTNCYSCQNWRLSSEHLI